MYDFVIAGGGLAGLSLACHLKKSALQNRPLCVIDREEKTKNDRTWGFWADEPTLFDDVVSRTWEKFQIVGEDFSRVIPLDGYRYQVIRGTDFYRYAHEMINQAGSVDFKLGTIEDIEDGRTSACVRVDGQSLCGRWVFDSLPYRPVRDAPYQRLRMHFRGWEIETPVPAFDPETMTFLDFRTPQEGEMRFFYVLPFSERRALIEYTVFSRQVLRRTEYEASIRRYLSDVLKISDYTLCSEERGAVPITDDPLIRTLGRRVMAIGARAGRIKPSTGYAFMRVQKDSEEIVESLLLHGHPFDVPDDPDLYDVLDAVMLKVMDTRGDHIQKAFTTMFKRNPVDHILRFLDEEATPWQNLMLVATMPPQVFLRAFFKVSFRENLFDIMKG
jgi:lycopene beta-cyclase